MAKRLEELKTFLLARKYPIQLIEGGINKAKAIEVTTLRATKEITQENTIAYVSTHNPINVEFFNTIHENLTILTQDTRMKDIMSNFKIIKSKRQPNNLKKLPTRARCTPNRPIKGIERCKRSNCGLCPYLLEGKTYTFKSGQHFTLKFNGSCNIENVIYAMKCNGCSQDYIGETGNLRNSVTLHKQHIRHPDMAILPVSRHIAECAGNQDIKFQIIPIYKMNNSDSGTRKRKELQLIKVFKPALNAK